MQWIYNYFIQPVSHSYGQYCVGGSLWCQIPYNDSTLSLSLTHEYSRKAQRCNREGEWCNATKGLQFTSLDLHALFPPSLDLIKSDILLPFFPLSLKPSCFMVCKHYAYLTSLPDSEESRANGTMATISSLWYIALRAPPIRWISLGLSPSLSVNILQRRNGSTERESDAMVQMY